MNTCLFMDIDGTIADASRRFKAAGKEPRKRGPAYTKWLRRVQSRDALLEDPPSEALRRLCFQLQGPAANFAYLTGRSAIYRDVTSAWLLNNSFPEAPLLMRPARSRSNPGDVKERLIKEHIKYWGFTSVIVVDDDPTGHIQEMCKRNGYTFLKATGVK